jgi:hypothetical protein
VQAGRCSRSPVEVQLRLSRWAALAPSAAAGQAVPVQQVLHASAAAAMGDDVSGLTVVGDCTMFLQAACQPAQAKVLISPSSQPPLVVLGILTGVRLVSSVFQVLSLW